MSPVVEKTPSDGAGDPWKQTTLAMCLFWCITWDGSLLLHQQKLLYSLECGAELQQADRAVARSGSEQKKTTMQRDWLITIDIRAAALIEEDSGKYLG